jgi:LmbE family N-acetylglucosaminyl deacetylase
VSISQLVSTSSRVLVLAAHTDDEFGCGGTVTRIADSGAHIRYLAFSDCVESVPAGFPPDVLRRECAQCMTALGCEADDIEVLSFPVRHLPARRQEILEYLVKIRREYQPDLVLLPSSHDTHQDHRTVYEEGFRAFKTSTILGYELPQNIISFSNSAFIKLTRAHLERKITALAHYASQEQRAYATRAFIESLATVRGVQCGAQYAEAFELIRLVVP